MNVFSAEIASAIDFGAELTMWAQTHGLRILGIVVLSLFAYQMARRVLDRSLQWRRGKEAGRRATLHTVLLLVLRILFGSTAVLLVLPEFGVSTGPLIASLGLFGLAFSFGAQTLVRDVVSGFFLLAEDLCRVGEEIEVSTVRGRVEGLRIRTLVLRTGEGSLVFIPYGEIKTLVNFSRSKTPS